MHFQVFLFPISLRILIIGAYPGFAEIAKHWSFLAENKTFKRRIWPEMPVPDKRKIVEAITEKIVVGKDEIVLGIPREISKPIFEKWRKGEDSNLR